MVEIEKEDGIMGIDSGDFDEFWKGRNECERCHKMFGEEPCDTVFCILGPSYLSSSQRNRVRQSIASGEPWARNLNPKDWSEHDD